MSGSFRDVAEVRAFVAADPSLGPLAEAARGNDADPAHDAAHAYRVGLWTARLAGPGVPRRASIAAALLHDVVNVRKDSPRRAEASALSAEAARRLLPRAGFTPRETAEIADAILTHSFSRGETPRSPLGDALQDADRLEALGALGLFRCVATGAALGARFFDADDPWAERRALDDRAFSLDHFFAKLLGLPATMRTDEGRREAERRARLLIDVARALGDEIGAPPPRLRLDGAP
jgi:uncharacterized protein